MAVSRKVKVAVIIVAGVIVLSWLVLLLFFGLGGARATLESTISDALQGYASIDRLSYIPFGTSRSEDIQIFVEIDGRHERLISVDHAKIVPMLRPLLSGRVEFESAELDGVRIDLRLMPDRPERAVNIEHLTRQRDPDDDNGRDGMRVFPPRQLEIRDLGISVRPFIHGYIPFELIRLSLWPFPGDPNQRVGVGTIQSSVIGPGMIGAHLNLPANNFALRYEGLGIPFHTDFINQLPLAPKSVATQIIIPDGEIGLSFNLMRQGEASRMQAQAELRGIDVRWLMYPIAINNATGQISYDGNIVRIDEFTCLIPASETLAVFRLDGRMFDDGIMAEFNLDNLNLTDEFLAFLPGTDELLNNISISGEFGLTGSIHTQPGWGFPRSWGEGEFRGQMILLQYPIPISRLTTTLRTSERGSVIIDHLEAQIGEGITRSSVSASGTLDVNTNVATMSFASPGVFVTNTLLEQIGVVPDEIMNMLRIQGRISVMGEVVQAIEAGIFEVRAVLESLNVSMTEYPAVAASNVIGVVQFAQNRLEISDVAASMLGGELRMGGAATFADDGTVGGEIVVRNIDIGKIPEELFDIPLMGLLDIDLQFEGEPTVEGMRIVGTMSLSEGRLFELPLVVSIIQFLDLRPPGEIIFTDVRARFTYGNGVLRIRRLEFISETLVVAIRGEVTIDGRLDLRAGLGYQQPFLEGIPLVGPIIAFFTGTIRRALTTIRVTGTIEDPELTLETIGTITRPLTAVFEFIGEEIIGGF